MRLIGALQQTTWILIRVRTVTLYMEYLSVRFELLAELYKLIETFGFWVKYLHKYLFLTLTEKCELDDLNDF